MKKLFFIILVSAAAMSCNNPRKTVRFANGAYVTAMNNTAVEYGNGSKVCLVNVNGFGWTVCSDGEINDTTYTVVTNFKGNSKVNKVKHRIGTIVER